MIIPVSVDHQVSTTGQRPPSMLVWYQTQASGLIGSPTLPSRRRLDRSCVAGRSGSHGGSLPCRRSPPTRSISSSTSWQRCSKLAWSRSPRSPFSTWVVDWAIALAWISRCPSAVTSCFRARRSPGPCHAAGYRRRGRGGAWGCVPVASWPPTCWACPWEAGPSVDDHARSYALAWLASLQSHRQAVQSNHSLPHFPHPNRQPQPGQPTGHNG